MPTEESETIEAVRVAAVPISIEIDAMVAALPDGKDEHPPHLISGFLNLRSDRTAAEISR